MNRIDRLFAILLKISDGKLFQAEKLAEEFELSERTIYRDMSALIEMGIPIHSEAGVGYQLKQGYFLPPLLLEKDEAIAAGFALKFLTSYINDNTQNPSLNALRKIESVIPQKVRAEYQRELEVLDFVPRSIGIPFSNAHFQMLLTAIKNQHLVDFKYVSYREENGESRQIEPVKLFFSPEVNTWYLEAYCLTRNDWRLFRLDRVEQVTPTEIRFTSRLRDQHQYHPELPETNRAELTVPSEKARWIREKQHWSFVSEHTTSDGLIVLEYRKFDWYSFINWLCTISDNIVRIEPEEVKKKLQTKISDLQKLLT